MTNRKILALVGPAGCGKSTLAKFILIERPDFWRLPFSGPLKLMIEKLLSVQGASQQEIYRMLHGDLKETPTPLLGGCSPRHAMQTLGTEWRNLLNRDLWTQVWQNQIERRDVRAVVVEDMRFLHEAEMVRKLGGKIIRIWRTDSNIDSIAAAHVSEQEHWQINTDLEIYNDQTPEHMISQLYSLGELK